METRFFIYDMATDQMRVMAPTAEQIEKSYAYSDAWNKPRGPMQVISEIPVSEGIDLLNFKEFPRTIIMEGVALYARNKAARTALERDGNASVQA